MRTNPRIEQLLDQAQAERRCAIGETPSDRRALILRVRDGSVVSPYRGLYARRAYWQALDPIAQTIHTARALAILHPKWVFAGTTAASIHGYDHSRSLHADGIISIASPRSQQVRDSARLHRIPMRTIPAARVDGLLVTDPIRTLLDCGVSLSFQEALPIFDAAAKRGVPIGDVRSRYAGDGSKAAALTQLCSYANGLSDNGGESLARAVMIMNGFLLPQLQREFANPDNPTAPYRTDFSWDLTGMALIVAEYDGMEKYALPDGTGRRRSIQAAVHEERRREEHLRQQGVTAIVRLEYEDVVNPMLMMRKLLTAGVPRCG